MSHPHPTSREAAAASAVLPAVPIALLLDKRLMPLERNAWMILHASADAGGHVTDLSYAQLRQFLACVPDNELASRETVARTLTVLRLTRWIHVEANIRNPLTGRLSTNHYVVHSQPLPITEVCQRDLTWLTLLEQAFTHASLAVRQVAHAMLAELTTAPELLRQMPATIRERVQRLPLPPSHDDDDDQALPPDLPASPASHPERSDDPTPLKQPNGIVRSSFCSKHTYVPRTRERTSSVAAEDLRLPADFAALTAEQQRDVLRGLRRLDSRQRQPVLDEWSARCLLGQVLKPVAYLFGLIRKALAGEFRLWAAARRAPDATPTTVGPPCVQPPNPLPASPTQRMETRSASPEIVKKHLEQIAAMLRVPPADAPPPPPRPSLPRIFHQ